MSTAFQPLPQPQPLGRAVALAFLMWELRSFDAMRGFLQDFGFVTDDQDPSRLLARGVGPSAALYMAERGAVDRFVGAAFTLSDDTNLNVYVHQLQGHWLDPARIPGGGRGVELRDPSGRRVWLLQGQAPSAALDSRTSVTPLANGPTTPVRVDAPLRTPLAPAQVQRLGHVVFQTVDFPGLAAWYQRVLGLLPTDVQYLADGSPNIAFLRLNRGAEPTDHHSVVIVGGIEDKYEHSAYEVVDLDAVGQGQQYLRGQGHQHVWGLGRHLIGSQIFDYWADPHGFQFEHYADGDLCTSAFPTAYSPLTFGSVWAWGQDAPSSMKPAKNLGNLLRLIRLLATGRISWRRLQLLNASIAAPGRSWQ